MRSRYHKRIALLGSFGLVLALGRCSPNTASVSKIRAEGGQGSSFSPAAPDGSLAAAPNSSMNELELKTRVLDNEDYTLDGKATYQNLVQDFTDKGERVEEIVITGEDSEFSGKLKELLRSGYTEIPELDDKSAQSVEIFPQYDLSSAEITDRGIDKVKFVLVPAGPNQWRLTTEPSVKDSETASEALKNLHKLKLVFKSKEDPKKADAGKARDKQTQKDKQAFAQTRRASGAGGPPEVYPAVDPNELPN